MTRELQGVVIGLLGVAIFRLALGTAYLNYVKESMKPWLLLAGAAMILLAIAVIVDAIRRPDPLNHGLDHGVAGAHGHDHGHAPRTAWLLLLPIATIILVAPPALGSYAAGRDDGNSISEPRTVLPPLPAGDPVPVFLSDYVTRAIWEGGTSLEGRVVELEGFVLRQDAGDWLLARLQIACCAADAFASKVRPVGLPEETLTLPSDTWVRITGTWAPDDDPTIPVVLVDSISTIPAPVNPYD
jgi:uncharacterized repeat protein (TIGR03943 family)